tara:strand:+ start:458 stop:1279 length:822 start_codon:yes stop_codon:yes gene_type:complete
MNQLTLINGDCLIEMKKMADKSIDVIFCDLPYGQTNCKWDTLIDLDEFWIEVMRIKKLHTPIIMTCTTKFGVSLINSAPKKCPFRYDLIWCKSASVGFLRSKKAPMRKHEMIYLFYEREPFYDISSHKHKFLDKKDTKTSKEGAYGKGIQIKQPKVMGSRYDPPLPDSLVKEGGSDGNITEEYEAIYGTLKPADYIPNSLLEIKSTKGKHSTEKPVQLMEWILKYYSKVDDVIFDPTMGSGSMGVACKNMNRKFIGIEMDEEIFKVAEGRLAD